MPSKLKTDRMKQTLDYIIFDADDTLWINEPFFRETEQQLCELLSEYADQEECLRTLYEKEMQNLAIYGFGIKGFMLSMIETGLQLSNNQITAGCIEQILLLGKEQLTHPVELLEGVKDTLKELSQHYRLVLATKGDLLDQERKLQLSGLTEYFDHIEIMSDKTDIAYRKLFTTLNAQPENVMMVGNSMKSDILPILKLGGKAVYIPFYTTWVHEVVNEEVEHPNLKTVESIREITQILL